MEGVPGEGIVYSRKSFRTEGVMCDRRWWGTRLGSTLAVTVARLMSWMSSAVGKSMGLTDGIWLLAGWAEVVVGIGGYRADEADEAVVAEDMPCNASSKRHDKRRK